MTDWNKIFGSSDPVRPPEGAALVVYAIGMGWLVIFGLFWVFPIAGILLGLFFVFCVVIVLVEYVKEYYGERKLKAVRSRLLADGWATEKPQTPGYYLVTTNLHDDTVLFVVTKVYGKETTTMRNNAKVVFTEATGLNVSSRSIIFCGVGPTWDEMYVWFKKIRDFTDAELSDVSVDQYPDTN